MFGYATAYKPSLRVREYEYYRAQYCGLCHAMGKCTGCLSRMTLSYDMAFFSLVREAIAQADTGFEKKRCIRHPFKKRTVTKLNPQLEFSSYAGAILTYQKIKDNIADERGIKRFGAKFCSALFRKMEKQGVKNLPEADSFVREKLNELHKIEEEKTMSIDAPASAFADIMAYLLSYGFEDEKKLIAEKIGFRLGRWIYMTDALDDYESDRKSGSYNPFVLLYGGENFSNESLKSISYMLCGELELATSAFDLVDDKNSDRVEIIKNILYLGMPNSAKIILEKKNGEHK